MRSQTTLVATVTLELDEAEVNWLRAVVQNPIGVGAEEEHSHDQAMRQRFWDALARARS